MSVASKRYPHTQRGITLIELMVAMVLGLIVAAGIVTVFISTSSSNRAQNQMARLQEEGRFAVTRLKEDLAMANGQYCTNSGGLAKPAAASQVFLDGLRTPKVYANGASVINAMNDVTTKWADTSGTNTYPAAPSSAYSFPSYLSMRGYDCTKAACLPQDPHAKVSAIPDMAKTIGKRVIGTDVLTLRYVDSSRGWAIGAGGSTLATTSSASSVLQSITVAPAASSGEPPASDFQSGDLAMLADCSNAQIFAVIKTGNVLTPDPASNLGSPVSQQPLSAPKLFDFNRDYLSVTYYLKVVDNGNGTTTGALMRRVNGNKPNPLGSEDELVRGIERLDFRYGIEDANGKVRYLTAGDVDAAVGISCPPSEPYAITQAGCLWRAVQSIEVNLVMDGQIPLYSLTPNELLYSYHSDVPANASPVGPASHSIKPSDQGFVDSMIRREFTAIVSVRNFNP